MRSRILYGLLFLTLVFIDQLTKLAVAASFHLGESRELIGDFIRLTHVKNPGAAFSVSFGGPEVMFAITVLVIGVLVYMVAKGIIRPETVSGKIALAMVFSGAVGNLIDRVRMGEVTDFIDMGIGPHRWPVYNVADIAITIGMALLFITYARQTEHPSNSDESSPDSTCSSESGV